MRVTEFWELIGVRRTDEDFAAPTDELATRDAATITAFEDHLTEALHALDTPEHAKAARARNDWFLYVTASVSTPCRQCRRSTTNYRGKGTFGYQARSLLESFEPLPSSGECARTGRRQTQSWQRGRMTRATDHMHCHAAGRAPADRGPSRYVLHVETTLRRLPVRDTMTTD
jgi:hypothetical protein